MHGKKKENKKKDEKRILKSQAKAAEYKEMWQSFIQARKNNDFNKEVLDLTTKMIHYTTDNYTIWNFRRKIIDQIENLFPVEEKIELLKKELEWNRRLLERNHKSYSCWHHRRWTTKKLQTNMDWEGELNLCTFALNMDQRNFHCWNYRRFVVIEGNIDLHGEIEYSLQKIEENFSNYSAWHHRSYILPLLYNGEELINAIINDFDLVKNAFYTEPDDQSAWFYHNWLMLMTKKINPTNFEERARTEISMCKELLSIEPKAKWPKVTSLQIMKDIGIKDEELPSLLEQIKSEDSLHTNFYQEFFGNNQ